MATIKSSPLPPPGFGGQTTKITEADKAAIMAQANQVIDFFLNGRGSFTSDGPRKPEVGPPEYDNTVRDLNDFKALVLTAKQYADDPDHVLDSVVELFRNTVDQLNRIAGDHDPAESDRITRGPPDLTDPMDRHPPADRSQTSPPSNGPILGQPITFQTLNPADDPPTARYTDDKTNPVASQGGGRSIATGDGAPTAFASRGGSNAPASLFSYLMSAGNSAGIDPISSAKPPLPGPPAFQAAPPLQPDATPDSADGSPTRFLIGRTYDPSQGSPFKLQPVLAPASPDGSLSLDDAYLEYLRRLSAV